MSIEISSIADDYFYSLNPLAKRIGDDVAAVKDAYEGLWNTLSLNEKNQAVDETIIQPEVALKYTSKKLNSYKQLDGYYPKLKFQTGMKYIVDDTGKTLRWKDEHSAPFSFMTQSQMNLDCLEPSNETNSKELSSYILDKSHFISSNKFICINDSLDDNYSHTSSPISFYQSENCSDTVFSTEDCSTLVSSGIDNDNTDGIFSKIINKTSLLKLQSNSDDDMESLMPQKNNKVLSKNSSLKNQLNISFNGHQKSTDTESTALLDTPSSFSSYQSSHLSLEPDIPKTGFEFLDNW